MKLPAPIPSGMKYQPEEVKLESSTDDNDVDMPLFGKQLKSAPVSRSAVLPTAVSRSAAVLPPPPPPSLRQPDIKLDEDIAMFGKPMPDIKPYPNLKEEEGDYHDDDDDSVSFGKPLPKHEPQSPLKTSLKEEGGGEEIMFGKPLQKENLTTGEQMASAPPSKPLFPSAMFMSLPSASSQPPATASAWTPQQQSKSGLRDEAGFISDLLPMESYSKLIAVYGEDVVRPLFQKSPAFPSYFKL